MQVLLLTEPLTESLQQTHSEANLRRETGGIASDGNQMGILMVYNQSVICWLKELMYLQVLLPCSSMSVALHGFNEMIKQLYSAQLAPQISTPKIFIYCTVLCNNNNPHPFRSDVGQLQEVLPAEDQQSGAAGHGRLVQVREEEDRQDNQQARRRRHQVPSPPPSSLTQQLPFVSRK